MRLGCFGLLWLATGCVDAPTEKIDADETTSPMLTDTGSVPATTEEVDQTEPTVPDTEPNPRFADVVVDAPGASDAPFRDPALAVNGVRGAGKGSGGTDVFSLGYRVGLDDTLTVAWSGARVFDGEGDDLVVFENPFRFGQDAWFMDLTMVEVSPDGVSWLSFPVDYTAPDESVYETNKAYWEGFAGRTPVWFHEEEFFVDPFFSKMAGGDGFDLASLPEGALKEVVMQEGVLEVRLRSAATVINPDTDAPFVRDPVSNGPDIDGVYARYLISVR